jgi:hypothetical protein
LNPYPPEKKSAIHPPQRTDITPGKEEAKVEPAKKSDDLDILELYKMPVDYTLELPDEIRIIVRPKKKGFAAELDGVGRFFSQGIGRPVKTILREIKKKSYTDIEIVFADNEDAQAVYWSFFEGQKCLLIWPD